MCPLYDNPAIPLAIATEESSMAGSGQGVGMEMCW